MAEGSLYLPDARGRSATAVPGKSDLRDENIYSAIVVAHGGAGQQKMFTVPQGQTIPTLKGSSITVTAAHQLTYTELTTNLTQAGQMGAGLGDASIRAMGLMLEVAPIAFSGGTDPGFGATTQEAMDVASKTFFQFKVAGKIQIQGPSTLFPAPGGMFGFSNVTATSLVTNGAMGVPRKLRVQIPVQRTDNLEGNVGVAGSASYSFRTTTSAGASSLLWGVLYANVRGDVR